MDLNEKTMWTQKEVADYFRVVPSTVKNWRDRGLIKYWQAPGSSRVLYFSEEIKDFRDANTFNGKGDDRSKTQQKMKRVPVISPRNKENWRI